MEQYKGHWSFSGNGNRLPAHWRPTAVRSNLVGDAETQQQQQ